MCDGQLFLRYALARFERRCKKAPWMAWKYKVLRLKRKLKTFLDKEVRPLNYTLKPTKLILSPFPTRRSSRLAECDRVCDDSLASEESVMYR